MSSIQPEELVRFARLIEKQLGIIYEDHNYFQLQARIQEIMTLYSLPSVEDLYTKVQGQSAGDIKQMFFDVATNNETFFFRDNKVFQALSSFILPEIISQIKPGETLRIWSAACSFGQEPYSLAILFEELKNKIPIPKFEILATDISQRALERARQASYSQLEVQRGLPTPLLIKHFTKTPENFWVLKPAVRSSVQFLEKNLKDSFYTLGPFHLILCRNVLIYQKLESRIDIVERMSKRLLPNGYFILGSSESMLGVSQNFEQHIRDGVVLHQIK